MSRARNWVFTLNNYTELEWKALTELECSYIVLGKEIGEKCGTPHIQGYVEFENPKLLGGVKKLLSERAHIEKRKGTAKQASDYCKEDGDFFEKGTISQVQGARNDLVRACSLIKETKSMKSVIDEEPTTFVKFSKGLTLYHCALLPPRDPNTKPIVYWFWGQTGTGKTKSAYELTTSMFAKPTENKWWDGYEQQEGILLDDLRKDNFSLSFLLRLLDRHPMRVEIKGGSVQINSKYIIITSDEAPHHWYQGNDLAQLRRRVDYQVHKGLVHKGDGVILDPSPLLEEETDD